MGATPRPTKPTKALEAPLLQHTKAPTSTYKTYQGKLAPTPQQEITLNALGEHMHGVLAREVQEALEQGLPRGKEPLRTWRARLTTELGSRWASSIMSGVREQVNLAQRNHRAHLKDLDARIASCAQQVRSGKVRFKGKERTLTRGEYFRATRRLQELQHRRAHARVSLCLGGARLQQQDPGAWALKRFFCGAPGETGKRGGNETFLLSPRVQEGTGEFLGYDLRVNVPLHLKEALGDKVFLEVPPLGRGDVQVLQALEERRAVTVDLERTKRGWRVLVGVDTVAPARPVRKRFRALGIDVNAGHLEIAVLDASGNPCGAPVRVAFGLGGSSSWGLAQVRHAVARVGRLSERVGASVWVLEDLQGFGGSRSREGNAGGAWFRGVVSAMPVGVLAQEFARAATARGVEVRRVNPAFTSLWAGPWVPPGKESTGHDGAAVVIGRRGLGFGARRASSRSVSAVGTSRALGSGSRGGALQGSVALGASASVSSVRAVVPGRVL